MSDIVERLRYPSFVLANTDIGRPELYEVQAVADMREAADEIERLRAIVEQYRSSVAGLRAVNGQIGEALNSVQSHLAQSFSDIKKEIRK